ncbi:hypothetical protein JXB31_04160 [Candidatus Woesearchaeota archaeon]|nr:hypothetical protein [Candidatus Woesearchaeota archaeon]
MKKIIIMFFLMTILSFSVSAETIDLSGVDPIIDDYNSGSIDIAQFVVYVNSYLKEQYQELEKEGHFEGFNANDIKQMFGGVGEDSYVMKETKDFGVMFGSYKGNEGYSIVWGLPPSQKAIDKAISEAEQSYANSIIQEEQSKIDISEETEEIERLESEKERILQTISDKEDEEIVANLKDELNNINEQIAAVNVRLDDKQDILDGNVPVDFGDLDIESVICEARYKEEIKIRKLLEEAMPDFPGWYFGEFKKGVDNYFSIASGHQYLMHVIDSNLGAIRDGCVKNKEGYGSIDIDHETDSERFKVWQEGDETFYEFYFMPSKDMMKKILETKITDPTASSSGYSTGNQDARMEKIKKLADKYGGSFDAIVKIVDSNGNNILYKHVTINPEVIIASKTVSENPEDIDVSLEIDYDRMYDYMEYISKDVQGTKPINADWNKNSKSGNVGHVFGILSKGFGMWINGVKVKPVSEAPGLILNLKLITEAFSD